MGKAGISKKLSQAALKLTEGLFSHTVDMALWMVVYTGSMGTPQKASGQEWRARINADHFLERINYEVIKHALSNARRKGWLRKATRRRAMPEITAAGRRRLAAILPAYDEKRTWDGRMHLVTYDIPETRRRDRDILREYLGRLGCGRLQDSVWITPYNPIDTLRNFIEENQLGGTIIISDLGRDGSIGEEDLSALIVRLYHLEDLNERYDEWLEAVEGKVKIEHEDLIHYLSILRDDPQLPFMLLPRWWSGDKAYEKVRFLLCKLSI